MFFVTIDEGAESEPFFCLPLFSFQNVDAYPSGLPRSRGNARQQSPRRKLILDAGIDHTKLLAQLQLRLQVPGLLLLLTLPGLFLVQLHSVLLHVVGAERLRIDLDDGILQ